MRIAATSPHDHRQRRWEIDGFQHADGIWTWKSNGRSESAALWLPYLQGVERSKGRQKWRLKYNGGEFDADLTRVDCVMLYGASGVLPLEFLDDLNSLRIPLLIHRRNLTNPYMFVPTSGKDAKDMLSAQIRARDHLIKRCHVARTLVKARFQAGVPRVPVADGSWRDLNRCRSIKTIRAWEAEHARLFWGTYFSDLGLAGEHRREDGPVQAALDAGSFFMFGVVLRWLLLHRLSPCHGFLHEPTDYPSLVYDLIEPFRYTVEMAVASAVRKHIARGLEEAAPTNLSKLLTESSLSALKDSLDQTVYTHPTRQWVRRKNLVHGAVLSLRAYLLGDMPRLVLPVESQPSGGRPPKVTYRIPGQRREATRSRLPRVGDDRVTGEKVPPN